MAAWDSLSLCLPKTKSDKLGKLLSEEIWEERDEEEPAKDGEG